MIDCIMKKMKDILNVNQMIILKQVLEEALISSEIEIKEKYVQDHASTTRKISIGKAS